MISTGGTIVEVVDKLVEIRIAISSCCRRNAWSASQRRPSKAHGGTERVSINRLERFAVPATLILAYGRWWFARWREMLIGRMWRATMPQNPRPDRRNRVGRSNPAFGSHQGACSLLFDALSRRNKRCAAGKPVAYSRVHPGRVGLPSNPMRTALTGRRTPQVAPTVSSLVHHGSPSADTRMGDVGDHPRADCLGNTRNIPSHSDWLIYSRANRWAVRGI